MSSPASSILMSGSPKITNRLPVAVAFRSPPMTEPSLRQQVTRLRKLVAERLAVDLGVVLHQNDFIDSKEREGYAALLPEVTR
jgi:hypothetical protein